MMYDLEPLQKLQDQIEECGFQNEYYKQIKVKKSDKDDDDSEKIKGRGLNIMY